MKIVILTENHPDPQARFRGEHGLAIYVEYASRHYLIDTGQSDLFLNNAEALGIDLQSIDYAVITHGHYDHINGLGPFLKINSKAKIIMSENILKQEYLSVKNHNKRNIGINFLPDSSVTDRLIFISRNASFEGGLFILKDVSGNYPVPAANRSLFKKSGENEIADDFNHEIIPCFVSPQELVVFTGCAHQGILNIIESVHRTFPRKKVNSVIGGFHLSDSSPENRYESEEEIRSIGQRLISEYPGTDFYTGHCTGDLVFSHLCSITGHRFHPLHTGLRLNKEYKE